MPPQLPRQAPRVWDARDKSVAVGDQRELGAVDMQQRGVNARVNQRIQEADIKLKWVPAPPSSHVGSFALWDARELMKARTADGAWIVDSPRDLPPSRIYVNFKVQPSSTRRTSQSYRSTIRGRKTTQYVYYVDSHEAAKRIYQAMLSSDHPGQVIHAELENKMPYQRVT